MWSQDPRAGSRSHCPPSPTGHTLRAMPRVISAPTSVATLPIKPPTMEPALVARRLRMSTGGTITDAPTFRLVGHARC